MKLNNTNTQSSLFERRQQEKIVTKTSIPIDVARINTNLGEKSQEENIKWRQRCKEQEKKNEALADLQKGFINEMKKMKLNFSAIIAREGFDTLYYGEYRNSKYKRIILKRIEETENGLESSIPDAEFLPKDIPNLVKYVIPKVSRDTVEIEDDFNFDVNDFEFNFEQDLTLGENIDADLNEVENENVDDTKTFLKLWKDKQEKDVTSVATSGKKSKSKYKTMLDVAENELEAEEAIADEQDILSDIDVVDAIDSYVKTPKAEYLTHPYYIDGYRIDYDFILFVPSKGSRETLTYGDNKIYQYYGSLVNRVFNFDYESSVTLESSTSTYQGNACMLTVHLLKGKTGTEKVETYTAFSGKRLLIRYTCNDLTITLDLEDTYLSYKLNELPYTLERLDSNKKAVKDHFNSKIQGCTLYLPHISKFRSILNLEYVPNSDYEILDTINKVIDFTEKDLMPFGLPKTPDGTIDWNGERTEVAGGDAETTGLLVHDGIANPDKLVTWQVALRDHQSYSIPFRMRYTQNVPLKEALMVLKPAFEQVKWLCHNIQADASFLASEGILLNGVEDSMHLVGHQIPFVKKHGYLPFGMALDDIVYQFNGNNMIDLNKYVFKPLGVSFDYSLLTAIYQLWYGCPDADQMRMAWKCLRPKLNPLQESAYRTHVRYSRDIGILSQYAGVGINIENMKIHRKEAVDDNEKIEKLIYDYTHKTPQELPLSSSAKISDYLFGTLGIPTDNVKKTDGGKPSADKHTIELLAKIPADTEGTYFTEDIIVDKDAGPEGILKASDLNLLKYPQCKLMRVWADNNKNITGFFNGFILNSHDGRYHPHVRTGYTDTYRDTERSQITKKTVKYEIGTYDPNTHDYNSSDYMAEEFRLASYLSKDDRLSTLLANSETDPHTMVTAELDGIPQYQVDHDRRGEIKKCNFGIIYGMRERTLAKNLYNTLFPTDAQVAAAGKLYRQYCYSREELLAGLEVSRKMVRDRGYVYNALGYRMAYAQVLDIDDAVEQVFDATRNAPLEPHIDRKKIGKMTALMTVAGNAPIQSLAAGILKESYVKLASVLREQGIGHREMAIPLVIHDEIGAPYDRSVLHFVQVMENIKNSFETDLPYLEKDIDIRLFIGVGFDKVWGKSKDDSHEIPPILQDILINKYHKGELLTKEEYGDKVEDYTIRLKKEWLQERLAKVYETEIKEGKIQRHNFVYKLNHELYLQGQVKDMFELKKKLDKDNQLNNVELYLEIALGYYKMTLDDVEIEMGEPIIEETVPVGFEDGMYEIFYTNLCPDEDGVNNFLPHNRFKKISPKEIEFDITNLSQPTIDNLTEYFQSISNPIYDIHNSQLIFSYPRHYDRKDIWIKTVPLTMGEDIDAILNGKKAAYDRTQQKTILIDNTELLYYMKDDQFRLNQKVLNMYSAEFQSQLWTLLMQSFKPRDLVYNPKIELCLEIENPTELNNNVVAWPEHYSTMFYPMGIDEKITKLQNRYTLYCNNK